MTEEISDELRKMEEALWEMVDAGHYEEAKKELAEFFKPLFEETKDLPDETKGKAFLEWTLLYAGMKSRLDSREAALLEKMTAFLKEQEKQPKGKEQKLWWKKLLRVK